MVKARDVLDYMVREEELLWSIARLDDESFEILKRFRLVTLKLLLDRTRGKTNSEEFIELCEEGQMLWDIISKNENIVDA